MAGMEVHAAFHLASCITPPSLAGFCFMIYANAGHSMMQTILRTVLAHGLFLL